MGDPMASLVADLFEKNNLSKVFGNYQTDTELQKAREKYNEAQNEYKAKFRNTLNNDDDMKKDMFLSINKRNALEELKGIHANYRKALEKLIAEKKLNDAKQSAAGTDDDSKALRSEYNNLKFMNLDLNNNLRVNKRKTQYELESLKSIRTYRSTFMSVYILLVFVFLILMFQKGKYKEYKFWGIFLLICLYPYFINYIMLKIITNIKFIFNHFTPVNSYRNLYNQDVNKSDSEDIDLSYHYTYLSPVIEEKINVSSSEKIDTLESDKRKLQDLNDDLNNRFDTYKEIYKLQTQ